MRRFLDKAKSLLIKPDRRWQAVVLATMQRQLDSEDQPRDENGRWSSGGSAGESAKGASHSAHAASQKAHASGKAADHKAAAKAHEKAAKAEGALQAQHDLRAKEGVGKSVGQNKLLAIQAAGAKKQHE